MHFIDWCHHVLQTLEDERFNPHLSNHALQNILFGDTSQQAGFHTSDAQHGMFHAIKALSAAGLAEEERYKLKITPMGRDVLSDPKEYWRAICGQRLDSEERDMLQLINKLSPQEGINPDHSWLKDVETDEVLAAFNLSPPPPQTNEHMRDLQKYLYDLPKSLADRVLLSARGFIGYRVRLTPTYQGLVWETRRELVDAELMAQSLSSKSISKFGVPDHMAFQEALRTLDPGAGPVSVIFLDLDNFKSVNDNYSHNVGDQVIKEAIHIVQRAVENKGMVFHRSGDEMLVLLTHFSESESYAVSENIRQAIEKNDFPVIGQGVHNCDFRCGNFSELL